MDYSTKIAELLLEIKAIKLSAKEPFVWASGLKSPIYCDNRLSLSYPYVRSEIKSGLVNASTHFASFDKVAGVATAGIPHGMLLADSLGLPFCYVRSTAKKHGRKNLIEGLLEEGDRVLVIEDLISTGGSSLNAITALRDRGAEVIGLLAIFTYEFSLASDRFAAQEITLETLTNYSRLIEVAQDKQYIDDEDMQLLKAWHESPSTWMT